MNRLCVTLAFGIVFAGCVRTNQVEQPGISLQALADSQEKNRSARPLKATFIALDSGLSGQLFLWESDGEEDFWLNTIPSPLHGSSGFLRCCTLRIYNFSEQPITVPLLTDGVYKIETNQGIYPLYPLCRFGSEFSYPKTLELLDQARPLEQLPALKWTKVLLGIRISEESQEEEIVPKRLLSADGFSQPWFEVDSVTLDRFIRHPDPSKLQKVLRSEPR